MITSYLLKIPTLQDLYEWEIYHDALLLVVKELSQEELDKILLSEYNLPPEAMGGSRSFFQHIADEISAAIQVVKPQLEKLRTISEQQRIERTSYEQTRDYLVKAIDTLLDYPEKKREVLVPVEAESERFVQHNQLFSIERIVFGSFFSLLRDSEVLAHSDMLLDLKKQLIGQRPFHHSYALKQDFTEFLTGETLTAYRTAVQLFEVLSQKIKGGSDQALTDRYDELCDSLFDSTTEKLHIVSLPDLLIAQASNLLLDLPGDAPFFDTSERFSGIYPEPNIEAVEPHLRYIEGLFRKIRGEEVLFLDIHFLAGCGFSLNMR